MHTSFQLLKCLQLTAGNTHAPQTFANVLKVYHNLLKEREANPDAKERYPLATKPVVAVGEDGPIGGDKHVATYFVSPNYEG